MCMSESMILNPFFIGDLPHRHDAVSIVSNYNYRGRAVNGIAC
jgi:hypothetical protein